MKYHLEDKICFEKLETSQIRGFKKHLVETNSLRNYCLRCGEWL